MSKPRLRALDVRPIEYQGQACLLLRDPQQISPHQFVAPQPLAAVLAYADGHHDVPAMVRAFARKYGIHLPAELVTDLIDALDEALMLDNERADAARQPVLADYRAAPHRAPALAGGGYPATRIALWQHLQDHLEAAADGIEPLTVDWSRPVGLLSPHIDYARGGAVYAQVWQRAAQIAREAELVILLGTDHYGSDPFTLTRQHYATPYGVLPTDTTIVDQLAEVIGPEAAFAGELRHRGEHSLELVAVWLHHMRGGAPVPLVPILTGSFYPYMLNGATPGGDATIAAVLEVLRSAAAGKRTLVVASGDLAHVGPAFGGRALDRAGRRRLAAADDELIAAMRGGDADGFFGAIKQVQDRNNVCGVAPIFLTMQLLGGLPGEQWGYAVCPADDAETSAVTVTGMVFGG